MAKSIPLKNTLLWCGRLLLGGTFAAAAVAKIADPAGFVADIGHYKLLPYPLTVTAGIYLPWLELICGISALCRWRERAALILMLCLCVLFFAALSSAWFRGLDINCGCFGHSASSTITTALARSLALGFLALLLFIHESDARNP